MPSYEVSLAIVGYAWVDIDADSADAAIEQATSEWRNAIGDLQNHELTAIGVVQDGVAMMEPR
jgi:hypothetical protein